jgi:putative membrane protein
MRFVLAAIALGVAVVAVAFALLNSEPVALDLYFTRQTQPLALWLVLFLMLGVLIGLMVPLRALLRQRHRSRKLDRELRRLHDKGANAARKDG